MARASLVVIRILYLDLSVHIYETKMKEHTIIIKKRKKSENYGKPHFMSII
jgi:hypothetical protein